MRMCNEIREYRDGSVIWKQMPTVDLEFKALRKSKEPPQGSPESLKDYANVSFHCLDFWVL
jgi:hypothetical protein